jgi:hypothetical protein
MSLLQRSDLDDFRGNNGGDFSGAKAIVQRAIAAGLIRRGEVKGARDKVKGERTEPLPPLEPTGKQATVIEDVESRWVHISPAMAAEWLERNVRNRPVSQDTVTSYARDMKAGNWVATHQGIAFNDQSELIDGQHRLLAIIEANVTLLMMVTYALPSGVTESALTTMDCVDRGRTRSVADQLKIQHGMKDGTIIAAVCASLATLCHNGRTRRLSVGQTLQVHAAFAEPITHVVTKRSKEHGLRQKGVLAAFAFAMPVLPEAALWFARLNDRSDQLEQSDPIGLLRQFLTGETALLLCRGTDRGLSELCLQAIWLQSQGARITELTPSTQGVDEIRAGQSERVDAVGRIFEL